MRLFQLYNLQGEEIALYETERTDNDVQHDIEFAYGKAKDYEEAYLESDRDHSFSLVDEADKLLEKEGIHRIFIYGTATTDVL